MGHFQRLEDKKIVFRVLVVDIGTSMLAGVVTAYAGLALGFNSWAIYAMVGIAGHLGVKAIAVFEQMFNAWIKYTKG